MPGTSSFRVGCRFLTLVRDGGFFVRHYEEFCTGADKLNPLPSGVVVSSGVGGGRRFLTRGAMNKNSGVLAAGFVVPLLFLRKRFQKVAHRRGREIEVTFHWQIESAANTFKFRENKISPFRKNANDVSEKQEVVASGRAFARVPCPASVRREKFHVRDRVRLFFLAAKRWKQDENFLREEFHLSWFERSARSGTIREAWL